MTQRQQRTLAFCNRVRVALGKKPRKTLAKGNLSDSKSCPIANTIYEYGIRAASTFLIVDHKSDRLMLTGAGFDVSVDGRIRYPQYASEFVARFDQGQIPELVK